jgi:hypothetical protein
MTGWSCTRNAVASAESSPILVGSAGLVASAGLGCRSVAARSCGGRDDDDDAKNENDDNGKEQVPRRKGSSSNTRVVDRTTSTGRIIVFLVDDVDDGDANAVMVLKAGVSAIILEVLLRSEESSL